MSIFEWSIVCAVLAMVIILFGWLIDGVLQERKKKEIGAIVSRRLKGKKYWRSF